MTVSEPVEMTQYSGYTMRKRAEIDPFYVDRSDLDEQDRPWVQHKQSRGVLKDYSLKHKVSIEYDMNDDSIKGRIFKLKIDDYEVVLSYEEFLRIGRFI